MLAQRAYGQTAVTLEAIRRECQAGRGGDAADFIAHVFKAGDASIQGEVPLAMTAKHRRCLCRSRGSLTSFLIRRARPLA